MKTTKTSKHLYNIMQSFPRTQKEPRRHDVWLALFPYEKLGNMEKIRPIYITSTTDDTVRCKKITTNPNYGKKIKTKLCGKKYKFLYKDSYLNDNVIEIPKYKLYGKIRHGIEMEETEDDKV